MSIKAKIAAAVASVGVLAIGYQIGTAGSTITTSQSTDPTAPAPTTTTSSAPTTTTTTTTTTSAPATTTTTTSAPATTTTKPAGVTGAFTGATATNKYGSVTVTVTLTEGVITDVDAATTINESKSEKYVSMALPTLRSEVIAANGADVNLVSGATYTSESYIESLQSALDKAGR